MRFAHIADSHLGSWRQPELQQLNLESFQKAIDICIQEQVEFILFTGDLFDSAFPPIETLKQTFAEFRKLKDAGIKSYVIAGSHDFSVSGKTFLDVLEKAGFCQICEYEEIKEENNKETKDNQNKTNGIKEIILKPIHHKSCFIYGYPGKKSGLEVQDLKKIKINEPYENYFRILMLHTTLTEVAENLPIDSIPLNELPKADYYALGHIHIDFEDEINSKPAIYSGPTFPNNFKELEELQHGKFYIIDVNGFTKITKKELPIKKVDFIKLKINNALTATQKIISELEKRKLNDKIVLLKISGILTKGKTSDIKFSEIEEYLKKAGAYCFLKNTNKLEMEKQEIEIELKESEMEKVEEVLIKKYEKENPSDFNQLIFPLIGALSLEKQEDEKSASFESRLFSELNKVLEIELD